MPASESTRLSPCLRAPDPCEGFGKPQRKKGNRIFGNFMRAAATVAAHAIPGVGPVLGPVVGAAIGAGRGRNSTDPLLSSLGDGTSEAARLLELQRAIERETQMYETASNVLKARHDATMNSIRNLKS